MKMGHWNCLKNAMRLAIMHHKFVKQSLEYQNTRQILHASSRMKQRNLRYIGKYCISQDP